MLDGVAGAGVVWFLIYECKITFVCLIICFVCFVCLFVWVLLACSIVCYVCSLSCLVVVCFVSFVRFSFRLFDRSL